MRTYEHLNRAKFYRPTLGHDIVERRRLWDLLDSGAHLPLTLICGPAGYGKSTLVSSWLDQSSWSSVWISLEQGDSSIQCLITHLIIGIRQHQSDFGIELESFQNSPQPIAINVLSVHLVNAFSSLNQKLVVVLDDYHHLQNQDIDILFAECLKYPNPNLHLIVVSRTDPPISLQHYRSKGWLQEIRTRDLVFNLEETIHFLEKRNIEQPGKYNLQGLLNASEGWPTAIRLFALNFDDSNNIDGKIGELSKSELFYMDLIQKYLERSPALREFVLLMLSLDQFNYEISDYILSEIEMHPIDSQTAIRELAIDSFFIIPLDDKNYNYRFHHLIIDYFSRQRRNYLDDEKLKKINLAAAKWYKAQDQKNHALKHYLKAKEFGKATELFREYRLELLSETNWAELERIIGLIPVDIQDKCPEYLLSKAWLNIYKGDVFLMFSELEHIEKLILEFEYQSNELIAEWKSLKVYEDYNITRNYKKCINYCDFAIKHLPKEHIYARGYAWIFLGAAKQIIGSTEKAVLRIKEGLENESSSLVIGHQRLILNYLYWMDVNNDLLITNSTALIEHGQKYNNLEALANGYQFLGIAQYSLGRLNEAEDTLLKFYELRYHTIAVLHFMGMVALCKTLYFLGRENRLENVLGQLTELVNSQKDIYFHQSLIILKSEFSLLNGQIKKAIAQVKQVTKMSLVPLTNFFSPHLSIANILIYSENNEDRQKAEILVNNIENLVHKTNNSRFNADLLLLRARIELNRQKHGTARKFVHQAIEEAESKSIISPFLLADNELIDLIRTSCEKNYPNFYKELAELFELDSSNAHLPSNRELEVLELLKKQFSNKQIANALYISEKTVKRHCGNLFKKLGVHNRREAVIRGKELNLVY